MEKLNKKAFIDRCDIHEYGTKRPSLKAIYFTDDDGDVYIYIYAHGTRREHLKSFYNTYVSGHVDSLTIVPKDVWRGYPITWGKVNYYLENY